MKIKDILGESEVTLKPMPGAQEVDIDGKPVGTATTPDAANAIADLAKKGEFTPVGDQATSEDSSEQMTIPTTEYVKGIYATAAQNGLGAPEVEAVKKQMVLAPNGEVDIMATMQKALQAFQSPELKKLMSDLDKLVKQGETTQEVQSPFPSRNPGTPAAADAAAQANAPQQSHQSVMPSRNTRESHQDLVSQGNHDVGGDATDNFINQIRDKKWEKANRNPGASSRSTLSEKDELYKWLTIAGIK